MTYRLTLTLALTLAALASPRAQSATGNWEVLFDGTDVSAWRGYGLDSFPARGWHVDGDELVVEYSGTEEDGYGGDLITRDTYGDFELALEYKLSDTSNSGIFYLVRERPAEPIWHNAPEYQLLDDATYRAMMPELTASQLTGANYGLHAQQVDYARPVGEWNAARIVKRGPHVEHYLNDSLVVAYTIGDADWRRRYAESKFAEYPGYAAAGEGHLGLQDHGHRVAFRRVRVRRL